MNLKVSLAGLVLVEVELKAEQEIDELLPGRDMRSPD